MLAIERFMKRKVAFAALLLALLLCGVFRSAIATRLDSFDLDEAYHITAGVTYARLGDYRLNPEHPPLVKLWVGMSLRTHIFKTPQFRPLADNAATGAPGYVRTQRSPGFRFRAGDMACVWQPDWPVDGDSSRGFSDD